MTGEEIYEEPEITYGKPPRTTSEKNMIWLKDVLEAHIIEGEFNEDVPKPSLDALAMTLIAITTYDNPASESVPVPQIVLQWQRISGYSRVTSPNWRWMQS